MSKGKMMRIFGPRGLRIPAEEAGKDEDVRAGPNEPVLVREAYAKHLIDERVAQEVVARKKAEPASAEGGSGS